MKNIRCERDIFGMLKVLTRRTGGKRSNMTRENESITRLYKDGKEIILIGTAHVSRESAELVKAVIEEEKPDTVCIELDKQRYEAMMEGNKWEEMDIFQVIKEKKATLLLMNLALSSFQKRMANEFGIKPGQEMFQAIESAEAVGSELVLADRNIQVTFQRLWKGVGWSGRAKLMAQLFYSIFSNEKISEEELERLKSEDMLNGMLQEMTKSFPRLKTYLIDERDQYLADNIKQASGEKVVAVVGAAHVPGIIEEMKKEKEARQMTEELAKPPSTSYWPKIIAWAIPIIILSLIVYTFYSNPTVGLQQTISWLLWNGFLAAIGAAAAFAHPLAIVTAFIAAPITSLNPFLAAGWFAGFVQALTKRPHVKDFEQLSEAVLSVKGFWDNKVTRILLVVVFANIGSSLGTVIAGADVVRLFLENLFG